MRDAFAPLDPTGCCLIVLTLDRYGTYSGEKRWETAQAAYRDLSRLSNEFLKRLRKWMKRMGWGVLANQWVATVEMHKSGWPHVNFVLWSKDLAQWIEDEKREKMTDGRMNEQEANRLSGELADIATNAGWGLVSTAERARSRDEALGYITKTAGKVDESIGELSKLCQLPLNAPFRFRRLRAGKGFLPQRKKSDVMTGTLVRRQNSSDGTRDVLPLHNVKGDAVTHSEECCATEERIWISELEAAHRCARQVRQFGMKAVEVPAVTHWLRKQRVTEVHYSKGTEVWASGQPVNDTRPQMEDCYGRIPGSEGVQYARAIGQRDDSSSELQAAAPADKAVCRQTHFPWG